MALVEDLLRRRVPQVIAVYFGASWGLVQFVDFMTLRYAFSPHLTTLSLVVPLLLLPSVTLVTYFHGAPGQDEWVLAERIGIPTNLVVAVVVLFIFFQGKDLGAATTTVTVTDEEGVETERVIPKTEFRKRVTVYFFDAEDADTAAAWLQYGLPIAVLTDLYQDEFIDLRAPILFADRLREAGFESMVDVPFSLAREIAEEQHRDHFVTGTVSVVDGEIQTTVSLYEAGRGSLVEERTYTGSDVMALADQISVQLREDLRIPDLGEEGARDLPVAEMLTESSLAYRLSTEAFQAMQIDRDFGLATSLLEQAIAEDPTFADAQSTLATLYMMTNRQAESVAPMQAAMDHLYRLPERARFVVKSNYYFLVRNDQDKAMAVLEMWADLFPDDLQAYQARLLVQTLRGDKEGSLASLKKILELDPGQRDVLLQIGDLQETMGDFAASRATFQEYADEFPENHQVLTKLAGLARRDGDLEGARSHYERALLLAPSDLGLTVGMASVERSLGRFDEALAQLQVAQNMAGTPEERAQVHSGYEAYFSFRGQIDAVIEHMEQRLAEAPSYLPGLSIAQQQLMEAGTYAQAGREDEAFAMVEGARSQLPPPFDALAPLGELQIYLALEDADAIEATLPGVESFITSFQYEALRPVMFRAQALVHELRGEYREAIEQYEEQGRLSPSNTLIPISLGRCYRGLGEHDRAVSSIQESLRGSPFSPRANYELALAYEAMGRMDEARTHLDRALEVWADADPGYRPAERARNAAERIGG